MPRRGNPCVAVVDDEEAVRVMVRRVLRLGQYDTVSFESGEGLLGALASLVPACAILDVHMPGMSGIEVQVKMRAMRKDIPVIFITASRDPTLDVMVREANAVALLRKPFPSGDLLSAVDSVVRRQPSDGT